MIRVVADTNILVSALEFGGLPGKFLTLAKTGLPFKLVTSEVLLDELEGKLRGKFQWPRSRMELARELLIHLCDLVSTVDTLNVVIEDPDDDRVLECALAGLANYIVTGDKHLLKLYVLQHHPHPHRPPVPGPPPTSLLSSLPCYHRT